MAPDTMFHIIQTEIAGILDASQAAYFVASIAMSATFGILSAMLPRHSFVLLSLPFAFFGGLAGPHYADKFDIYLTTNLMANTALEVLAGAGAAVFSVGLLFVLASSWSSVSAPENTKINVPRRVGRPQSVMRDLPG